jgi:hypothetical protein
VISLNMTTPSKDPLVGSTFDSLDEMMQAYAKQAVSIASSEHGIQLDYSQASIEALESILAKLESAPQADLQVLTKLWGGYFGEVLRRQYTSEWLMSEYPGSHFAVPTLEIGGSRIYPLMKVHRRLTMGAQESLVAFEKMVSQRLGHKRQQLH